MSDLSTYLRLAAKRPLLSADEERTLSRQIRLGHQASDGPADGHGTREDQSSVQLGNEARRLLIESNLLLVASVARSFPTNTIVDLSDLIQAGNQGLMIAAEGFDPERGFRFSTYATTWIRSRIIRAIDKGTPALGLPIDTVNSLRAAMRASAGSGDDLPDALAALAKAYVAVSLDAPAAAGSTASLGELQPSLDDSVEAVAEARLERRMLHGRIAQLPVLQRHALQVRFGLLDDQPRSNLATARVLGISARRSRRLVDEALAALGSLLPMNDLPQAEGMVTLS